MSSNIQLSSIQDYAFNGCKSLTTLVVPNSVNNHNNISDNAFAGSSLQYVALLGINSDSTGLGDRVKNTGFFGLRKDCKIELGDGKVYSFSAGNSSYTKISDNSSEIKYQDIQSTDIVVSGNQTYKNKLNINNVYKFKDFIFNHCKDNNVPMVIIYLDSKTSIVSRNFMEKSLCDQEFSRELKNSYNIVYNGTQINREKSTLGFKSVFMIMDRNGDITHATEDVKKFDECLSVFFKGAKKPTFPSVYFIYNSQIASVESDISMENFTVID